MDDSTTVVTSSTQVVRPFKVIAVILIVICVAVMIAVLANNTWITAAGFHQGLWNECYNGTRIIPTLPSGLPATQTPSDIKCQGAPVIGWLSACQALTIMALLLTVIGLVLAIIALFKGKRFANLYKIAGVLQFVAAVFMLVTLALFPVMSVQQETLLNRSNWELAWGYGLGWGAFLLQVASGILLVFAPDKQEIYYSEKTYYQ
ncbi:transmembrane protein 47-like [Acanthaster planci]|uniref:Transmembrane protein 47-like n=1 Tax=Acanthaster planci TaxID=133434 RepID=A0A8B7YD86_ACAPL|nr:transmembrane protein 47-like [Acanthaster planci]